MNNLLLVPVVAPFLIGTILILFKNHHRTQRVISAVTAIIMLVFAFYITYEVYVNGIQTVELGTWVPPFGIVLVADLFASLMVILSSIVGVVCLFFAFQTISPEREKFFFYPFYMFLLAGVHGAFLTGDLFNLFVFFEVMLIASYILIVHGGTKYQLRESFKYVVINVFASIFFIVGIAYIYGITGTLNMAQIAERVGELEQTGVLNAIAVLFLLVFGMKGALFPLYFWLPNSYFGPPSAIAALFGGLLTKVGIYAIIRTFTLIFTHDPGFTHNLILFLAGGTMFFGVLGAVAQFDFKRILSYHIISQVGYMALGLGLYSQLAIAGAIYYIAHHIIVKPALFLFCGATEKITGTTDLKKMSGLLKTYPVLGWLFLVTAISLAGIPPLSGFFSKFALILDGIDQGRYFIVFISLLVGILTLFSMMKIFIYVFWGEESLKGEQRRQPLMPLLMPILPLVALTVILGFGAEPIFSFSMDVANELLEPANYINAVLKE
ncbi:Na+/H+ antiporter subunit D [Alteribacter natronophilus]|uniref:Na+/H+ antiporter subunit D n=1 Tax=Alteribacter natronophilus TaxID=2583810 RepID=UPI00110D8409|nr:Na+/H+ antiporter subunit D [Alteribacter natronophilus]TMW73894.1 Na+/H+ antiporter subunit D [Alteribacter natronophilus]